MPENVIDVRPIPPPQKHSSIFAMFHSLKPGEAMTLINDHDPKPLYYQFMAEMPNQFDWQYLEQGPTWKVQITHK